MIGNIAAGIYGTGAPPTAPGSYESISTVSVGLLGASSISFTSIPSTYKHLQIRALIRTNRTSTTDNFLIGFNGATSAYTAHSMRGTGQTSVFSNNNGGLTGVFNYYAAGNLAASNTFGVFVADILDYTNTSKNKVVRVFAGSDNNGDGGLSFNSGAWRTADQAITQINIAGQNGDNILNNSHFALYGIKD